MGGMLRVVQDKLKHLEWEEKVGWLHVLGQKAASDLDGRKS